MPDALIARGPKRAAESTPDRPYDPARLRRASRLTVQRLGNGQFRVSGQHERYYDVDVTADIPCYCKDAEYHGRGCKHELACRLASGDMALIQALGDMLAKAQQASEALMKQNRRKAG